MTRDNTHATTGLAAAASMQGRSSTAEVDSFVEETLPTISEASQPLLSQFFTHPDTEFEGTGNLTELQETQPISFVKELHTQFVLAAPLCLFNLLRFSLGTVSIAIIGHLDPEHLPDAALGTSFSNVTLLSGEYKNASITLAEKIVA